MLRLVNVSLRQRAIEGRFMTLCYATYDAKTRLLKFSNSGAPPPILCRRGKAEVLSVEGFPLGMFDAAEYQEREAVIEPGDCLILYTDGLVEARDPRGEEFGYERLKEVLERTYPLKAKKVIEGVLGEIEKFSLDNRKLDDQTIVVLKADETDQGRTVEATSHTALSKTT